MGNSQSSAVSRDGPRKPRRLARSRLRRNTSGQPMDDLDFCVGLSESDAANHLAASFLSKPCHRPTVEGLPMSVSSSRGDRTPSILSRFSRRGSRSHSVGDDFGPSEVSRLQFGEQRAYSVYEAAGTVNGLSTVDPPDGAAEPPYLLQRTQSWHEIRHGESAYGLQRRTGASAAIAPIAPIAPESQAIEIHKLFQSYQMERLSQLDNRFPDLNPTSAQQDAQSDTPSYAPMRRRSMILVPGVATRLDPDDIPVPPPPNRSKSNSLTLTLAEQPDFKAMVHSLPYLQVPITPTRTSVDSDSDSSSPVGPPLARARTPNNMDYQQLGGHKFGTLKVTNASPDPVSIVLPSTTVPNTTVASLEVPRKKEEAQLRVSDTTGLGISFLGGFSWEAESHLAGVRHSTPRGQNSPEGQKQEQAHEQAQARVADETAEPELEPEPTPRLSRSFSISLHRFSLHLSSSLVDPGGSDDGTSLSCDTCEAPRRSPSKPDSGYGSQISQESLRDAYQAQEPSKMLLPPNVMSLSGHARTNSNSKPPTIETDEVDDFASNNLLKKTVTHIPWKESVKESVKETSRLRKRKSLAAMAEAAHAAFSLRLRHKKSIAGLGLR